MKKCLSLLLTFFMIFSLVACGKSKAVLNVEELISAIGEVSLESKGAIESAQEAFDSLSEDEKSEVENYYVLVESQKSLEKLEELEEQRLIEEQKKAAIELGKEIYENIKTAWKTTEQIGNDLYSVWHGWVWEKEELAVGGLQFFVDETSLSMEEVIEGFAARNYTNEQFAKTGVYWNDISEDNKEEKTEI